MMDYTKTKIVSGPNDLLTREQFKKEVFHRSHGGCVVPGCVEWAVDAHHILDRKLWADGGYYLDNGAAVCEHHHWECEQGIIRVDEIRKFAGITTIHVPPQLDPNTVYDKWGTAMNAYYKFPKTMHLPWSPNLQNDDRLIENTLDLFNGPIIITEKMDGENTTMYRDHIHARSIDSKDHASRAWVKAKWGQIKNDIPDGYRICGENMFAQHSIFYQNLPSYFLGFAIFDETNMCLSWEESRTWFSLLGIATVPEIVEIDAGYYDPEGIERTIRYIGDRYIIRPGVEGYVVRRTCAFPYSDWSTKVAKYVRKGHVQTDQHWMEKPVEKNELRFW